MILMSVDLPAPFSPTSAWTSPRAQVERHAVERAQAGEGLADVSSVEKKAGTCWSRAAGWYHSRRRKTAAVAALRSSERETVKTAGKY